MARAAVILAAGKGTRMRSSKTKVLHQVGGRMMVDWTLALAESLNCERRILVIGTHSEDLSAVALERVGKENVAIQDPPIGTGHAVSCAEGALKGFDGHVVILYADTPLLPVDWPGALALALALVRVVDGLTQPLLELQERRLHQLPARRLLLGGEADLEAHAQPTKGAQGKEVSNLLT